MNAEIAKQWAAELRSGKWTQGRDALRAGEGHCCLGVLCELAIESGVAVKLEMKAGQLPTFDGKDDYPPARVKEWAGMKTYGGNLPAAVLPRYCGSLFELNDDPESTFAEIADIIEANAEAL